MKNKLLITALAAIIGFAMITCDTGGGGGGGNTPEGNNPGDSKGWIAVTNQPFYFDDSNILNDSSSLTLSSIHTIAYGNGKFVAGSSKGRMAYLSDN